VNVLRKVEQLHRHASRPTHAQRKYSFLVFKCICIYQLHNEELNDLYSSPSVVRVIKLGRMRLVGHVARVVERRDVYRVLMGKPEGKRPLGRPRHRWEDNIKVDL
jgi:Trk K+ transport system NAD-binding subunit